ncbi:MAG: type II secretion system protein [Phycisphaerae bacterium]|nr:type II secretion system protein [Phycisphaerae bacterium]
MQDRHRAFTLIELLVVIAIQANTSRYWCGVEAP